MTMLFQQMTKLNERYSIKIYKYFVYLIKNNLKYLNFI